MNTSEDDLDRIHSYLLDEMSPAARQAFEAECAANPDLAAALALERKVVTIVQQNSIIGVREAVLLAAERDRRRKRIRRWAITLPIIAAAACLALLLYFNLSGTSDFYSPPPRSLFADDSKGAPKGESLVKEALVQYDRQAFDSALAILATYPDTGKSIARVHFLRGHCYYQTNAFAAAVQEFLSTRQKTFPDSKLYRYTQWYLALAYLQAGNEPSAKAELQNLKATQWDQMDDDLKAKVTNLLKEMK